MIKKIILSILLFIFVGVIGLTSFIYFAPHKFFEIAANFVLPKDLKIDFSSAHFERSGKSVNLILEDLDVQKSSPRLNLPLGHVEVKVLFGFERPYITIQNLILKSEKPLQYFETFDPHPEPVEYSEQIRKIPSYLGYANTIFRFQHASIDIPTFEYVRLDGDSIKLSAEYQKDELKDHGQLQTKLSKNININGLFHLMPSAKLNLDIKNKQIQATLNLEFMGEKILLASEFSTPTGAGDAKGFINPQKFDVEVNLRGSKKLKLLKSFGELKSHFVGDLENKKLPVVFEAQLPLQSDIVPEHLHREVQMACQCHLPQILFISANGTLFGQAFLDGRDGTLVKTDISLDSISNILFALKLGGSIEIAKEHQQFVYKPKLDSSLIIYRFRRITQLLDALGLVIPAPFSVLDGTVIAKANTDVQMMQKITTDLSVDLNLKSKSQQVSMNHKIQISADSHFKNVAAIIKTNIDRIRLELPPLNPFAGLPQLKTDERIKLSKQSQPQSQMRMDLDFNIETATDGAIELMSNLADPFIPLDIQFQKVKESEQGHLRIRPFKIKYLRRTVAVDDVNIDLNPTSMGDYPLTAEMHVQQTSYKVMIHVGGTTANPSIKLSSDPDLSREDIISVLLYDHKTSQGSDAENVGNVQAAIADKAIGLFGIWAFASTPVKSVSYNPVTKVYEATFDIGNGVTASVGTNWDQQATLALRRRLSKRWVVTASWGNVGSVVLQWEKRF